MDLVALSSRLTRRWWLVVGVAAVAALGAATAGATDSQEHRTKLEFVLRPDASVTNDDLPGTLEALKSDGTLVQTVIGVLGNRATLRRAAADAHVTLTSAYTADTTAQPGTTLIDSTLSGPDQSLLNRLVAAYSREASLSVASSYPAYVLDRLSVDAVSADGGPGTGQIVILAFLFGGALGVVLVAAELRLEPYLRRQSHRAEPEPEPEPEAEPEPEPAPKPSWRSGPNGGPRPARSRPSPVKDEDEG